MRIALVRHLPASIAPGVCYGRLDVGMDPAAEVGLLASDVVLQGAARVWSSPARRCSVLAEAIGRALAVPLTFDTRLQELDFGEWEGRSWDTIPRGDLERWAESPMTFAPPGGESGAALIARVRDFRAELLGDGQDCVVVSHGGPLKVLMATLRGECVDLLVAAPALGSVTIVTCSPPAHEATGSA
jgi:alpha-ribazole phosphatase